VTTQGATAARRMLLSTVLPLAIVLPPSHTLCAAPPAARAGIRTSAAAALASAPGAEVTRRRASAFRAEASMCAAARHDVSSVTEGVGRWEHGGAGSSCVQRVSKIVLSRELDAALEHESARKAVLFGARSCSACRRLMPRIQRLAAERPLMRFFYIEQTVMTRDAFQAHGVRWLPTLAVFDERGEQVSSVCAAGSSMDTLRETVAYRKWGM